MRVPLLLGVGGHDHRVVLDGQVFERDHLEEIVRRATAERSLHLLGDRVGLALHERVAGVNIRTLTWAVDHHVVEPVAVLGGAAVDHGVGEAADVTRGHPGLGVLDDARVDAHNVERRAVGSDGRTLHHVPPPAVTEVVLELRTERTVVPEAVEAAVDLGCRVDESAALAERDELLHQGGTFGATGHGRLR